MDDEKRGDSVEGSPLDKSAGPKKWWQWLLLYPGLIIALLGAIPTLVEFKRSVSFDVPFGQGSEAEKQLKLWQLNFDCLNKSQVFRPIKNDKDIEIASIVCDTGDVLIVGKLPDRARQMKWVSWSDVVPTSGTRTAASPFSILLVSATHESDTDHGSETNASSSDAEANSNEEAVEHAPMIICQRWLDRALLLQRIKRSDGCVDQIVNAPKGLVQTSRVATCESSC